MTKKNKNNKIRKSFKDFLRAAFAGSIISFLIVLLTQIPFYLNFSAAKICTKPYCRFMV
jgi:hypothetical protein